MYYDNCPSCNHAAPLEGKCPDCGLVQTPAEQLDIDYMNHKGERRVRRIQPLPGTLRFTETEHHKPAQWVFDGIDCEKKAKRTYALSGVKAIGVYACAHLKFLEQDYDTHLALRVELQGEMLKAREEVAALKKSHDEAARAALAELAALKKDLGLAERTLAETREELGRTKALFNDEVDTHHHCDKANSDERAELQAKLDSEYKISEARAASHASIMKLANWLLSSGLALSGDNTDVVDLAIRIIKGHKETIAKLTSEVERQRSRAHLKDAPSEAEVAEGWRLCEKSRHPHLWNKVTHATGLYPSPVNQDTPKATCPAHAAKLLVGTEMKTTVCTCGKMPHVATCALQLTRPVTVEKARAARDGFVAAYPEIREYWDKMQKLALDPQKDYDPLIVDPLKLAKPVRIPSALPDLPPAGPTLTDEISKLREASTHCKECCGLPGQEWKTSNPMIPRVACPKHKEATLAWEKKYRGERTDLFKRVEKRLRERLMENVRGLMLGSKDFLEIAEASFVWVMREIENAGWELAPRKPLAMPKDFWPTFLSARAFAIREARKNNASWDAIVGMLNLANGDHAERIYLATSSEEKHIEGCACDSCGGPRLNPPCKRCGHSRLLHVTLWDSVEPAACGYLGRAAEDRCDCGMFVS